MCDVSNLSSKMGDFATCSRKVLVTGVFDCFHQEHLNFLRAARKVGDCLIVGVESDPRVRDLKGEGRPVKTQQHRVGEVGQLAEVDLAFILPTNFHLESQRLQVLKVIKPQYLAVSSHTPNLQNKKKLLELIDGELVVVYNHQPHTSTSQIIKHLSR